MRVGKPFKHLLPVLEAITLRRLLHKTRVDFTLLVAARVKAASYLLAIIHYALGAATLTLLLRRRAGVSLAMSAGTVMLVMMFDLGMVLSMVAVGATLISQTGVELQFGLIGVIIVVIVGGLALLRAPFSLGPLDRLRDLELFHAARKPSINVNVCAVTGASFERTITYVTLSCVYASHHVNHVKMIARSW